MNEVAPGAGWLKQILHICAESELTHIDLLLDQSDWAHAAVPALQRLTPAANWFSLFSGTPEEGLLRQAPLLMRLELEHWRHKAWLEELIGTCALESRLLLMLTPHPFEELCRTLQALSRVQWGGCPSLLRFYDPRVFPALLDTILTPDQRAPFLQLASFWSWLDRDGQPHWRDGECSAEPPRKPPPATITDAQHAQISGLSETQQLLDDRRFSHIGSNHEQRFAVLYPWVLQASKEEHFVEPGSYVLKQLSSIQSRDV